MQVDILNIKGDKTGRTLELPADIFEAEPNDHVIYLAVKQYLANRRSGTHKTLEKSELSGSTRKLHKQKGTGGSRKGNIRNPLYKGGGTIFGPKPRSYDFKLNRKVKDLAKISALSHKAKEQAIVVVEDIKLESPKTREVVSLLAALKLGGKKTLFVLPEYNDNLQLSVRNVPYLESSLLADVNNYDIVYALTLVYTEATAKMFSEEEA
jgi:large subunit ribosomal protein L4